MAKLTTIEGTPEEILTIVKGMGEKASPDPVENEESPAVVAEEVEEEEKTFVTVEVARRVMNRRPLSKEQKLVFKTLADAHPEWVPAATLQQVTGYARANFAGLMGAFGRRFTHTEGFVANSWLFDQEWDYETGAFKYRLPETTLAAVKAEGIA